MRKITKTGLILLLLLSMTSCTDLLGDLNNPADPKADNYEGVYTAESSEIHEIPSESVFSPQVKVAQVIDATGYDLQISNDEDLIEIVYEAVNQPENTFDTGYSLLPEGTYWCRARARTPEGNGNWSDVETFEIVAPSIGGPDEGTEFYDETPELFWDRITGAESYEISYSPDRNYSTETIITTDASLNSLPLATGTWFWRYRALNSSGDCSPWSESLSFATENLPPPAVEGFAAEIGQDNAILSWTKPAIEDLGGYEISLSPAVSGLDQPIIISPEETSAFITNLAANTSYTVSIQAVDSFDQKGDTTTTQVIPRTYNNTIYTISYDGNGATNGTAPRSQPKHPGMDVVLASNTGLLEREGYSFVGWNTEADGSGTDYEEGDSYSADEDLTLYANWTSNQHTIYFDANGGIGTMADLLVEEGNTIILHTSAFTREDYIFMGWSFTPAGDVVYSDAAELTMGTEDVYLYAQWVEFNHTITFFANGGIGTMDDQEISYGSTTILNKNTFTRPDYVFIGWSTTIDGSVEYLDKAEYTMGTVDVILYAQWTEYNHSIIFHANNGSGTMENQIVPSGSTVPINTNEFIRSDYVFLGWSISEFGEVEYADGADITIGFKNIELYAVWTEKYHSIIFNANNGIGYMNDQVVGIGETCTLFKNNYTRTGYKFRGWSSTVNGEIEYLDESTLIMGSEDLVLYAQWLPTHSIIFNNNGGFGTMEDLVACEGEKISLNPNSFTRSNYQFIGWALTADGSVKYNEESEITIGIEDLNLYAKWLPTHNVIFDSNGGTGSMEPQVIGEGLETTLENNIFTKNDCLFIGWSTSADGDIQYQNESLITMGSDDLTLYAIWEFTTISVELGRWHSIFLKSDGSAWSSGENGKGQLGDGTTTTSTSAIKILDGVTSIAAGSEHSLYLKDDGSLWGSGNNSEGELGDGTSNNRHSPVKIMENVKSMAAGDAHSLILKTDGTLLGTGWYGAIGPRPDFYTSHTLTPIEIMTNVKAISSSGYSTLILKNDNTLWGIGMNIHGQLGIGTNDDPDTPTLIMEEIRAMSIGGDHSVILKNDGSLWTTGYNGNGQLGNGSTDNSNIPIYIMDDIQFITAGTNNTFAIKSDGTLMGIGANLYGSFGIGHEFTTHSTPILINSDDFKSVAAISNTSIFIKDDGSLWATGYNTNGQFGNGTNDTSYTLIRIIIK